MTTQKIKIGDTWHPVNEVIAALEGGGITDHGLLGGLGDDDHTQYLRKDQADVPSGYLPIRPDGRVGDVIFTGIQTAATWPINTDGPELATLDFVHAQSAYDIEDHATGPLHPFIPQFAFAKAVDVLDIPDTWTEVNRLGTDVIQGTYMFGVSLTWAFDVTNRSAEFRLSTDNGQTWGQTYHIEPTDAQDVVPFLYQYPVEYGSAQPVGIILQAQKTADTGTLDVTFCDIYLQRVA